MSMGGMNAMQAVLGGLPADFPLPVVIVQHRGADSGETLLRYMRKHSALKLSEPQDKEPIMPGTVYIAAPDYHLLVDRGEFALSTEAPVAFARPSIDVLFETAANAYNEGVIGVVLTGASADGALGARCIKERGGYLIVQDPATAESPLMPRSAIAMAGPDRILGLSDIAPCLVDLAGCMAC
jgi:two-component system chemotaxis response regulator CheB